MKRFALHSLYDTIMAIVILYVVPTVPHKYAARWFNFTGTSPLPFQMFSPDFAYMQNYACCHEKSLILRERPEDSPVSSFATECTLFHDPHPR